jgi:hypothetical protein
LFQFVSSQLVQKWPGIPVLDNAHNESGLLHSISVESDQSPGQVQSKVVSRGNGALYQVELLGKDLKDPENAGGHPWTTQGDYESHLLLFNSSTIPTTYIVRIAAGTSTWEKRYVLAPSETRELSINQLMHEGIKDDTGRVLGSDANVGVAYWSTIDPGRGTGRLLVSSRSAVAAHNFSCGNTLVVCGINLSVFNSGIIPMLGYARYANVAGDCCLAWGQGACSSGLYQTGGTCGTSTSWSLGNTTIVGFNSPGDQFSSSPNFSGINLGSTYANVNVVQNGCGSFGGGNPSPVVESCPSTMTVNAAGSIIPFLSAYVPTYLTGMGLIADMRVDPQPLISMAPS